MEAARRVAWSIMADFKVKNAYKTGPTVKNVSNPAAASLMVRWTCICSEHVEHMWVSGSWLVGRR